jgi:hypothetical protein
MAAHEHLNQSLFHGTGGEITGGVVNPGKRVELGPGAYATNSRNLARNHAAQKAKSQGRLFGTVYSVRPLSKDDDVRKTKLEGGEYGGSVTSVDPKGLKVEEAVEYPLNTDAAPWATDLGTGPNSVV